MSIQTYIEDKVGFKVKGTYNTASGIAKPFDFGLTCHRLDTDELKDKLENQSETSIVDFLVSIVIDWSGVLDATNKPTPYSEAELRSLCKIPGVAGIAFHTYLAEVGAKAKN
jgi:hypothetical protein